MNGTRESYKQKNWQWRAILYISLFLIFAKPIGNFISKSLGLNEAYATTTTMINQVGISEAIGTTTPPISLTIDVKNDTATDYTVETKISSGQVDLLSRTFAAGETKHITIKPYSKIANPVGKGDIIFLSAPIASKNNQTCQEIHTLNYDLKKVNATAQPLAVNLSSINSRMECKDNAINPSDDE